MQVIKNHLSKEEKYTFALSELSNYLGIKDIQKIDLYFSRKKNICSLFA